MEISWPRVMFCVLKDLLNPSRYLKQLCSLILRWQPRGRQGRPVQRGSSFGLGLTGCGFCQVTSIHRTSVDRSRSHAGSLASPPQLRTSALDSIRVLEGETQTEHWGGSLQHLSWSASSCDVSPLWQSRLGDKRKMESRGNSHTVEYVS